MVLVPLTTSEHITYFAMANYTFTYVSKKPPAGNIGISGKGDI